MQMNVLLITDVYVPNANSSAVLMRDLALKLVEKGHNVWVLTLLDSNTKDTKVKFGITKEQGITVLRAKNFKKKGVGYIRRGISEVALPYTMVRAFHKYFRHNTLDLIISYSPPITLDKVIRKIKKRYMCKTYLVLRDIFPQCAKDVGALKNGFIYKYFKRVESQLYNVSDYIGVQSQRDYDSLYKVSKKLKEKSEVLYNWIDVTPYHKSSKIDFRAELGLQDKIVCLYAGNIGRYQELEFLFELIKINMAKKDVVFLIVGSGSHSQELRGKYEHLSNVIFKEFINPEQYPDLVKQCDIGLINLNRNLTIQNIPGKLLGYWSAKLPVLASVNLGNDLNEIIEEANGGFCSVTGNLSEYISNFDKLASNKETRLKLGLSGYTYLLNNFAVDSATNKILEHFTRK
jgi:glycosyltransferase involved in cell wall biosynthesis